MYTKKLALLFITLISTVCGNFFPKKVTKYYEKPKNEGTQSFATPLNITEISMDALKKAYPDMEFKIGNVLKNKNVNTAYVHVSQAIDGIELVNSAANVNIDIPSRTVLSTSMALWEKIKKFDPAKEGIEDLNLDIKGAIKKLSEHFNVECNEDELVVKEKNGISFVENVPFTVDNKVRGEKKYVTLSENYADSVWELSVEISDVWYLVRISTTTGGILNIENIANNAVYNAVPWNKIDITSGRMLLVDPYDKVASPLGWHQTSETEGTTTTSGNNIVVKENHGGSSVTLENKMADGGPDLIFDFDLDINDPVVDDYFPASATNVFVLTNKLHDVFYKFGFDEEFGNFQVNNFNKGGAGDDPVDILIQDRSGKNNANFATPVDGYSPKMRLYPFTSKTPEKDSALVNQIIIHEYGHGVSQRLTGGPDKTSCLSSDESNALSEGWSDFFAISMEITPSDTRDSEFLMFEWLYGTYARSCPITSNMEVNSLTYNSLTYSEEGSLECHSGGEVWAVILFEMMWNIIDIYGITEDMSEVDVDETMTGNVIALQIVMDAMKIQPCNPTFIEARDSIILAQQQRYNDDKIHCAIWKAFARRGMGENVFPPELSGGKVLYSNNFDIPSNCQ